jgi:hypothetical protein
MKERYNQVEAECVHLEDEVEDAIFHGDFDKLREVQERLLQAREELYTLKDALIVA